MNPTEILQKTHHITKPPPHPLMQLIQSTIQHLDQTYSEEQRIYAYMQEIEDA